MKKYYCFLVVLAVLFTLTACGMAQAEQPSGRTVEPIQQSTTQAADDQYIGKETAKQIALAHAKLKRDQAENLRVSFAYEDGRPVYEVEFRRGQMDYDYEVHAKSGKILSWNVED